MILRIPLHLLALFGLLVAFGGQTARSQPNRRLTPSTPTSQRQPVSTYTLAAPATPRQFGIATSVLTNTTYLANIVNVAPPPSVDLSIDSLEITQAVQTPSNSVPLVADRPAIVRVYAKYTGTTDPVSVTVSLTGTRAGVALPPVALGPQAVAAAPSRAIYSSSFNLLLPTAWLSGTVAITATVDSTTAVDEADEANNTKTATLVFNHVPPLDIEIVPVRYIHTGSRNPGVYPAPTQDTITDFIKRTYPLSSIHVTFHPAVDFTGDLSYIDAYDQAPYWSNGTTGLLDQVTALRSSEVGMNSLKVYYGLVSTGTSPSNSWLPLSGGFILGNGWIGQPRASAGLDIISPAVFELPDPDVTSDTAAHEIGHNLGRLHAPCDTAQDLDPDYPYLLASIMQFGVDVGKGTVLNPDVTKDVMSYCSPQWVSDYTYNALFDILSKNTTSAARATAVEILLIRAGIAPNGTASLAPAYGITGVPDAAPDASGYRVEFLDATGNVVSSQPVAVGEVEPPHVVRLAQGKLVPQASALSARGMDTRAPRLAINAVVAAPAQAFAGIRLVRADTVLATRALRPTGPAIATATPGIERRPDGTLLLRWNTAGNPALVRYTADNGATWATVGVDVLGGQLIVDAAKLPATTGYFAITPADSAAPTVQIALP